MVVALVFGLIPLAWTQQTSAAPMTARSVTVGSSVPDAVTTHSFKFTLTSVSPVGSIEFEYCDNTPFVGTVCTAPAGFSASAATLQSEAGETGFSIDPSSTVNRIVLSRIAVPTAAIPVQYVFQDVVNHSTQNSTVYVRIATFATTDGTGPRTDTGAVAYATVSNISVAGFVPPYLTFCVGVTVALNCSSSTGVLLNFGQLVTNQPRFVSSQFSVATNDPGGYATFIAGPTMISGNNVIPALDPPHASQTGTSQFGMNLRANSSPAVGTDPIGVGTGVIAAGYNTPNQFFFRNQLLTSSPVSSDFNRFTASYIVNVSGAQQPGIYSTTLTYIATAAF
jgi:hypothetical protein